MNEVIIHSQSISGDLMKLLIVDDNREIRDMLKIICSHLFVRILECDDGVSAVKIYNNEKPDWVLMDIKMKKMDGISATEKIISNYPDAKIIIVSQFNDRNFINSAKNSGAIEFVSKEDLTKIEEIIKKYLNNPDN